MFQFFGQSVQQSNNDGSAKKAVSRATGAALGAKTLILYLFLQEVDGDTEVIVKWSHSADGVNWYDESTAIIDTGAGADAAKGVYVGNTGSTVFGAFVRVAVTVQKRAAGASLRTVTLSLSGVFKPF